MNIPLIAAIAAASTLAVAGGAMTPIGAWYRTLKKPRWNPPNWAFGPAWSIILALWAWSAYLAWGGAVDAAGQRAVLILFGLNFVFHLVWSPLFFVARRPDWAFYEVTFLWSSILAMLWFVPEYSVKASWLLVPYFAWVSFAACLNFTIARMNARVSSPA